MKDNLFNINSFLGRFKNLRNPLDDKVKILNLVNKELNTSLVEKEITILKGVIRFNTSSLIKNVIFLKKTPLLEEIKKEFPDLGIKDII